MRLVREAPGRGVKVFIVGAGAAAHLAGVVAAHTTLPVIGVPIDSSALKGLDALLSTVQMPPGRSGRHGVDRQTRCDQRRRAGRADLALGDPAIAARLDQYKKKLAEKVEQAAARLDRSSADVIPSPESRIPTVKYSIVTFGCRVNQADSLRIEEALRARGGAEAGGRRRCRHREHVLGHGDARTRGRDRRSAASPATIRRRRSS